MRKLRENLPNRVYHLISRGYPPAVRLLAQRGAMRGAHRAFFCRQGQPLVVEARVQVDAEGQGGGAMVTVSLRPYHKGLTLEAPVVGLDEATGSKGVLNIPLDKPPVEIPVVELTLR